jgi:hypothetical protein
MVGGFRHFRVGSRVVVAAAALSASLGVSLVGGVPAGASPAVRHIAGYLTSETGTTAVQTDLGVPFVTCSHPDVAFEGVTNGVIAYNAAGTFSGAGIALTCSKGEPSYAAVVTINGVQTQLPDVVNPGDHVQLILDVKAHRTRVKMTDVLGWSEVRIGAGATTSEAGVGVVALSCAGDGCSPVPQFSAAGFFSARIDGADLTGATRSLLRSKAQGPQAKASVASGTSFWVHWRSTCTPNGAGHC